MKVGALLAALNEEAAVSGVVEGVLPHVASVCVVDDGSSDLTAERARQAGASVLRHPRNEGKGAALRTGLALLLAGELSHVLFLDADGQHDPGDIPRLLACAESTGADIVVAERAFRRDSMPAVRFYANTIGSRILSGLIGVPIRDSQTGFRLIRADALRGLHLTARRYEVETEILIKLARRGARIESVKVAATYDDIPSKMRPIRDVFRICMLAMRYRYLESE